MNLARVLFAALLGCGAVVTASSCTSLQRNYTSLPSVGPSGTPTVLPSGATPSPGPTGSAITSACQTEAPNATVVAMSLSISPATVTPYGQLFGYAQADSTGTYNNVAAVVAVTAGSSIQFANGDAPAPQAIYHSAVGFAGAAFPSLPYAFPSAAATQTGSVVSTTALWSTARLPGTSNCFSQTLVVPAGTYYFGDLDYYGTVQMRGVIVAQ